MSNAAKVAVLSKIQKYHKDNKHYLVTNQQKNKLQIQEANTSIHSAQKLFLQLKVFRQRTYSFKGYF